MNVLSPTPHPLPPLPDLRMFRRRVTAVVLFVVGMILTAAAPDWYRLAWLAPVGALLVVAAAFLLFSSWAAGDS
jgi:hypothetical protein